MYVTDIFNHCVIVLNEEDLSELNTFGKFGTSEGEFHFPTSVACGIDGKIYVVDNGNNRVQVFTPDGGFISAFGEFGNGEGQFNRPVGITIDSRKDMLYISERGNKRISMFKTDGQFVVSFCSKECENFDRG